MQTRVSSTVRLFPQPEVLGSCRHAWTWARMSTERRQHVRREVLIWVHYVCVCVCTYVSIHPSACNKPATVPFAWDQLVNRFSPWMIVLICGFWGCHCVTLGIIWVPSGSILELFWCSQGAFWQPRATQGPPEEAVWKKSPNNNVHGCSSGPLRAPQIHWNSKKFGGKFATRLRRAFSMANILKFWGLDVL